jgi:fatty-acyl-CoA synthase
MTNSVDFPLVWFALARLGVVTAWINFNQRNNVLAHSIQSAKAKAIVISAELQDGWIKVFYANLCKFVALCEAIRNGHVPADIKVFVYDSEDGAKPPSAELRSAVQVRRLIEATTDDPIDNVTVNFKGT